MKPRTRLAPDDRRSQLLDVAGRLVTEAGLDAFTMERLAQAADVSTSLLYNYFSSRAELLSALLHREYERRSEVLDAFVDTAETFEDLVRILVGLRFLRESEGRLVDTLLTDPDLAATVAETREHRLDLETEMLTRRFDREADFDAEQIQALVTAGDAVAAALAARAHNTDGDSGQLVDFAVAFILGGLTATADLVADEADRDRAQQRG